MTDSRTLFLMVPIFVGCAGTIECPNGFFECLGECQPLGTTCGAPDAGATDASPSDTGMRDTGMRDTGANDAADGNTADPCASRGDGVVIQSACASENTFYRCARSERVDCVSSQRCAEWRNTAGEREAGCFERDGIGQTTLPCNADDPGEARCDGNTVVHACVVNPRRAVENQPERIRRTFECVRWPDGTCVVLSGGIPQCTSPSAEPCDPGTFIDGCSPDGRARTICDPSVSLVYQATCEDSETCRVCSTGFRRGSSCIPTIAVPSDRVPVGPRSYDLISCVSDDRVRVAECMWEWTARCGDGRVCHEYLSAWAGDTAGCFSADTRFCEAPGTTECSRDGDVFYLCDERGVLLANSCVADRNLCDVSTGTCFDRDPVACVVDPMLVRCRTPEVQERCGTTGELELTRCPGGCVDDDGAAASTCNP